MKFLSYVFVLSVTFGSQAFAGERMAFVEMDTSRARPSFKLHLKEKLNGDWVDLNASVPNAVYPSIRRDGRKIAYSVASGPNSYELVVDTLGSPERQVFGGENEQWIQANFSGDGRFLVASVAEPESPAVIVLLQEKQGKYEEIQRISGEGQPLYYPSLSTSGDQLAYSKKRGAEMKIVLRDRASGETKSIREAGMLFKAANFSFDDSQLVFLGAKQEGHGMPSNIFVANLNEELEWGPLTDSTDIRFYRPGFTEQGRILVAMAAPGENYSCFFSSAENFAATKISLPTSCLMPSISSSIRFSRSATTPLPQPARSSFGSIEYKGKVYVVGGHQGPQHYYPESSFLAETLVFDRKTERWSRLGSLNIPRQSPELATYDSKVYVFGGFAFSDEHEKPKPYMTPADLEGLRKAREKRGEERREQKEREYDPNDPMISFQSLDVVEVLDLETGEWSVLDEPMPRRRSSHEVARVGQYAFLIGGWDATPEHHPDNPMLNGVFDRSFIREIDVFDMENEEFVQWEHDLEIPNPLRRAFSSVVQDGKIRIFGGIDSGTINIQFIDNVQELDPKTGEWTELAALPFASFAPAAEAVDEKLFVLGGSQLKEDGKSPYSDAIFYYLESRDQWIHSGSRLNQPRGFLPAHALPGGRLFTFGGHSSDNNGSNAPLRSAEILSLD